jgi:hypothetical protein
MRGEAKKMKRVSTVILALVIALAAADATMAFSKRVTLVNDTGIALSDVYWIQEGGNTCIFYGNLTYGDNFQCVFDEENPSFLGSGPPASKVKFRWDSVNIVDGSKIFLKADGGYSY